MRLHKIKTKKELKVGLDRLFEGIAGDCKKCNYIDCRGYIWLHPCETEEIRTETATVKINGEIVFVDSFIREKGKINPEKPQPVCRLRDSCGKCLIQEIKPVVCMLYPLNLRKINKEVWLVLNEDCLFVDNLKKRSRLNAFKEDARLLWNRLDKRFREGLLDAFKKAEAISRTPEDYHKEIIKMVRIS
jgi:Fe-S-cluster containining protein